MRHTVTQEDEMGCGAACVAFVANTTYQRALSVLGQQKAKSAGYQLKEMVDGLSQYGFEYHFKHVKPKMKKSIYQEGVIVFIKRSKKYPYGHYLIRHNGLWADSWINLVLDKDLGHAKSGYRSRLPGEAQWAIFPLSIKEGIF